MTSLLEPDNFRNNWYGWLTNQCSHVLLGQLIFIALMSIALVSGEFASRNLVWVGIAIGYALFELAQYGKKWDALEDFIFVCVYGAGIPAMVFKEVEPGSGLVQGDINSVLPLIGLFVFHATLGVILRVMGEKRA